MALVGVNLLVSAAFGTRLFLPGRAWPAVRRTLRLGPSSSSTSTRRGSPRRLAAPSSPSPTARSSWAWPALGWVLTAAVAGLQTLLAATGICVGCRLYFLRWWVPSAFARLFRRTDGLRPLEVPAINRIR